MPKDTFIDTHAHLDDPKFDPDRAEVIARAREAGIKRIITVGCWNGADGFGAVPDIVKNDDIFFAAFGVHPHDAKDVVDDTPFDEIRRLASELTDRGRTRVVGVGETGLDYYYDNSPREAQQRVFRKNIALARQLNLPLIIHTRDAWEDTVRIMEEEGAEETGGVFHCFSGDKAMARKALEMGFYISFSGMLTFPKAEAVRAALGVVPIEKVLVETDCPYLAPKSMRGSRNEPALVVETAGEVARVKGLSVGDVARITTLNAEDLFGLAPDGDTRTARVAYTIRNSLYLNVTNRCSNRCTFCAKFKSYTVKGHYLRLREEPDFARVMASIGDLGRDPTEYDEVVFCGFGEPLIRLDLVKEVGMHLKRRGCRIRIDTDGLANLVHGRNVLPELKFVDSISVSLNAPDPETYQKLVKTPFGDNAYPAILYFLREAKKHIARVQASVVAVPGLDVEACRKVAEDDLGVAFRVREYNTVG